MKREDIQLMVYTYAHFATDAMCAYMLYSRVAGSTLSAVLWMGVYHGLAFAFQPVFGILCDRYRHISWGMCGTALCLAGYLLSFVQELLIPAVFMLGIGNAFFHLEGGYVSLHREKRDIAPGGIFVAGGAPGVALGIYTGALKQGTALSLNIPAILFFGPVPLVLMALVPVSREQRERDGSFGIVSNERDVYSATSMVMISVIARGLLGRLIPAGTVIEGSGLWKALAVSLIVFAGKALGGILADRIGVKKAAWFSQIAGAVFALGGIWLRVLLLPALFCTNLAMALTLAVSSDLWPKNTGLAFGLSPLGLYIAAALGTYLSLSYSSGLILAAGLLVVSAGMMSKVVK